jgi:S-adenosyl-L-methionine hydrolase (adenosine-forming)
MAAITLITDWYNSDYYLGALKGKLLNLYPEVQIIDISHQIPSYAYTQAAFILKNSYHLFPTGTVHIVGVNSEASEENPFVAIKHNGHFFVGADNGIFGLVFADSEFKAVKLNINVITTFPELDVFADTAVLLSKGGKFEKLGTSYSKLYIHAPLLPAIDESVINGSIIYIDSYGNGITNISQEVFERVGKDRRFEILVQSNHNRIEQINKSYFETSGGELLALFNSTGMLEIAINKGNAAQLLNLGVNSVVRIKFSDTSEQEDLKLT